ncbi:uncharacterized protein LOC115232550 [Argonauta hians]
MLKATPIKTVTNRSVYQLLNVSSQNYQFVIDNMKYLYPQLSSLCPDPCKKEQLQKFYEQFSMLQSLHTCKNFENLKNRNFNWFIGLYLNKNSSSKCISLSKKDIFLLCKRANENFSKLLDLLLEQFPCLNLENDFGRDKQLSLLGLFYKKILQLKNKQDSSLDVIMMTAFTWSDIEQFNELTAEGYLENLSVTSQPKQIKRKKKTVSEINGPYLIESAKTTSLKCSSAGKVRKKPSTVAAIQNENTILFSSMKKKLREDIERYISEVCSTHKSILIAINESTFGNKSLEADTEKKPCIF